MKKHAEAFAYFIEIRGLFGWGGNFLTFQGHPASVGNHKADDMFKDDAFAAARLADDANDFAFIDFQVYIVEHHLIAEALF